MGRKFSGRIKSGMTNVNPAEPDGGGIGAARDSGRRRKGGHGECFGMREKVWKVSPLSYAIWLDKV